MPLSLDPTNLGKAASAVPGSIREAAKSPLGFACLATIVLCILAYAMFGNSSDLIKIVIFLSVLGSVLFFFVSVQFISSPRGIKPPGPLLQPTAFPARDSRGRFVPSTTRERQSTPETSNHA